MKLFKTRKLNSRGFSHIELFTGLAAIAIIAVAGVYVSTHNKSHAVAPVSPPSIFQNKFLITGANYYDEGGLHKESTGVNVYACKENANSNTWTIIVGFQNWSVIPGANGNMEWELYNNSTPTEPAANTTPQDSGYGWLNNLDAEETNFTVSHGGNISNYLFEKVNYAFVGAGTGWIPLSGNHVGAFANCN